MMKHLQHHKIHFVRASEWPGGSVPDHTARVEYRCCPYGWLRIPSMLLIGVGILGIVSRRVEPVGRALSFLNMPPEIACYIVVTGACILLGFSLICRYRQTDIVAEMPASDGREHWRSM